MAGAGAASQTWPGEKSGASIIVASVSFIGICKPFAGCRRSGYRSGHGSGWQEPASWMDHGNLCCGGGQGACLALVSGRFPALVEVSLPGGQRPGFALALEELGDGFAKAGIIKDAGDDPDVTHGALIMSTVRRGVEGSGITFKAGPGVGTVTRPGLPLPPGEPSINPVPRRMIAAAIAEVVGVGEDIEVEVSVADGEKIAEKTLNGRLGIIGGISILGTTGVVIPFSCSSWIHSIWRGIDVARAAGLNHVAGSTGAVSEKAVQAHHGLPEIALLDMGDFVGGMLKYLRDHPVAKVTIAGGVAKMTKLSQGMLDVHSREGLADLDALAGVAAKRRGCRSRCGDCRRQYRVAGFRACCRCRTAARRPYCRTCLADGRQGARRS